MRSSKGTLVTCAALRLAGGGAGGEALALVGRVAARDGFTGGFPHPAAPPPQVARRGGRPHAPARASRAQRRVAERELKAGVAPLASPGAALTHRHPPPPPPDNGSARVEGKLRQSAAVGGRGVGGEAPGKGARGGGDLGRQMSVVVCRRPAVALPPLWGRCHRRAVVVTSTPSLAWARPTAGGHLWGEAFPGSIYLHFT